MSRQVLKLWTRASSGFSSVTLAWWQSGPPGWRELTDVIREAMSEFHAASLRAGADGSE